MASSSAARSISKHLSGNSRRLLLFGSVAAVVGGAAAYKRFMSGTGSKPGATATDLATGEDFDALGWGTVTEPEAITVTTRDGAVLSVWDVAPATGSKKSPTVVLPHCWGCSHAVWTPVARRLVEAGNRVVLYDQRGHGASTRGTAPLSIETLAEDFAAILDDRNVKDAVLAGHSMGGMTIMSLATFRPAVLAERGRAIVLVATAAGDMSPGMAQANEVAARFIASPVISRALTSSQGHRFVRGVFGTDPVRAQMDLTRHLFAECDPSVRAGFLTSMATMNLLEGIATITLPTTILVGSRDRLTAPVRSDQMINAIPGSRLVTLPGRGHMLPLEDPDAVTDEIIRAVKG
jgi:non-heme chloroperoxidase